MIPEDAERNDQPEPPPVSDERLIAPFTFTQEELDDLRKNGVTLTSIIQELKKRQRSAA